MAEYRWGVPNEDFTEFVLLDTAVNPGEVTCFSLSNSTQVYFPVGLQQNWQNATFSSTLFPGEIFFLVVGMLWYLAIVVFTGYHFVLHIMLRLPDAPFFNLSTTALFISLIFLISKWLCCDNIINDMHLRPIYLHCVDFERRYGSESASRSGVFVFPRIALLRNLFNYRD